MASSTNSVSNEKKAYGIGDKITFEGKAEYTITNVEWTEERNQFEQSNPEKVLKVTYNVTNLSDKDAVVGMGMDLYVAKKWKPMQIQIPQKRFQQDVVMKERSSILV